MNKILPIILVVVFPPNAFAGTPIGDFFGALFVFAFIGFVLYILYMILESLGKKAKNKFDDSVVGMSLKVKKEKLKKELDEIERKKDDTLNNEFLEKANTTIADLQNKDFEGYKDEFKKIFENLLKDGESEVDKEELFKQLLNHVKQSGQPEPDLGMRVMMYAFVEKIEDDSISFLQRVEEIHGGINGGLSEWAKQYESRGYTVTEYAKNCQRKICLADTFPGTYTKDERGNFFLESHANILGLTVEEYFLKREEYPEGKKLYLEDE